MPDNLTQGQRRYCMSRIKGKDTDLEVLVRSALHSKGLRFRKHVKTLPGKPDIVFPKTMVVVFIDGDFWHGYRFPAWENKVSDFWKEKISKTRERDQRNFRKLRAMGWQVIRLWQHEIKKDVGKCIEKILIAFNDHAEIT
jgi:DNA mismatch endonuclease (patch repair protein)